jgi:hypothetical protein
MMRSRGSVAMAENMSAYLATCSDSALTRWGIFLCLQKYGFIVKAQQNPKPELQPEV